MNRGSCCKTENGVLLHYSFYISVTDAYLKCYRDLIQCTLVKIRPLEILSLNCCVILVKLDYLLVEDTSAYLK